MINNISLHSVGNKLLNEPCFCSDRALELDDALMELLTDYFLLSFKSEEYYHFHHETDIKYNEVFDMVSAIFDNPAILHEQSVSLAKHLFEHSNHPKIKGGEFYVVYFNDCTVAGETVDAVGIFKSENKDTFLKVYPSGDALELESQQGVNINKLDKGCLIYNTERADGYIVAIVDNTNKGAEAHYWVDDFLQLQQRKDEYYNTENVLSLCKKFVTKELPQHFEVSKADQVDLLNKSVKFFKEKDSFDMDAFTSEVISQPEIIDSFNSYRNSYEQERDISIMDNFAISDTAVKRQARSFKSIIKLDKNFHIYVHGDRTLIENGEDDKGKFYKVYYNQET